MQSVNQRYYPIVIADYTSDHFESINAGGPQPILKAYRMREEDLA